MSYRHSSYRKVRKAIKATEEAMAAGTTPQRHGRQRLRLWIDALPGTSQLPKPASWGKPRGKAV